MASPSTTAFLLLDVAGKACALRRESVREILPLPHLHEPPTAGGALAGFLNLGGAAIPVVDLARLFGLRDRSELDPHQHLVLSADGALALLVDRVVDFLSVFDEAVRSVDDGRTFNGCVESEIARGDVLVHGLSFDRILRAEERARLEAHTKSAAERWAALDATPEP